MKKTCLINLLILIAWAKMSAQPIVEYNTKVYTIERKFNSAKAFFVDSTVFKQHYYSPRNYKSKIFISDLPIDSSGFEIDKCDFVKGHIVLGRNHFMSNKYNYEYHYDFYHIDLQVKTIKLIGKLHNTYISPLSSFYRATVKGNDSVVFKLNPVTLKMEEWLTTYAQFPELGIYEDHRFWELGSIWEISDHKLLMEFVECPGDCYNYRYLTFDLTTKEYSVVQWYDSLRREEIKHNETRIGQSDPGYARIDFLIKTFDKDYYSYGYMDSGEEIIIHNEDYIFDKDFNIVTPALKKSRYSNTFNYIDSQRVSVMSGVTLDNDKTVFVPYKYTLPIERSLYRIYHDQEILKEDLQGFGQYELPILKNFILAKHNYGFESEFYQAYFNLFEFYSFKEKRQSRKKQVTQLLTETDKTNLEIINKAISELSQE